MRKHAFLAALLALLMLLPTLAACGDKTPGNTPVNTPNTTATPTVSDTTAPVETEPAETEYPAPQIEAVDYTGKELRILVNEPRAEFNYDEAVYTENSGDVINDAIFKRNTQIMDKYGLKILSTGASTGAGLKTFTNAINAGTNDFHFGSIRICDIMSLAASGMMSNIADLNYIDIEAPWYYQTLQDALSIGGEDYLLTGYFNMRIFDSAPGLYYNKDMADKHQIASMEDMVFDGTWTLDKFFEICSQVGNDINQDGIIDETDEVGLTAHPGGILNFVVGADADFVRKNSDDIPVYIGVDEKNEGTLSKILTNLYTAPASLHKEYAKFTSFTGGFNEGRSLFLLNCLYEMPNLAANGTKFGVLPMPKANEAQENYRIHTHSKLGTAIGVPNNNTELEMTTAVLEDMMYLSYKYIYPAHIEKTMQYRYAADSNATEILKIMFNSLCIEMSTALNLTCDSELRKLGNVHSTDIASTYAASAEKNKKTIETYVASFTNKQ
ncbi:MAG: extracellular solute-binding protein [Clostridia bacterium]|nr:extracellular solute-binding protein [Clostridia bacterium]